MPKRKKARKAPRSGPYTPVKGKHGVSLPGGDFGPDTAAQRFSRVVEPVTHVDEKTGEVKTSPNGAKRARRIDIAEGYHRRHYINKRQLKAALALREAYEQTQKSPPAINPVQVDTSPKPDQAVTILLNRLSIFHNVARHATLDWGLLFHVCCEDRVISSYPKCQGRHYQDGMDRLRNGLDVLADGLGY